MTESEILLNLGPDSPQPLKGEAGARLLELLQGMVKRTLTTRFGGVFIKEEHLRDEVVGDVALKVIERSPLPVAANGDAASRSYLSNMLGNRYRDLKKRSRIHEDIDEMHHLAAPVEEPGHEQAAEARERGRAMLDRAVDEMIETKRERDREGMRKTWEGLVALVFDEVPMWTLVDREVGPEATEAERKTVRNRFFKKHQYFRGYLAEWLDSAIEAGRVDEDEARIHRELQAFLIQCQTPRGTGSDPVKGAASAGRTSARSGTSREQTR